MLSPAENLAHGLLGLAAAALSQAGTATVAEGDDLIATPFSTTSQPDWAEAIRLWNENGRDLIAGLAPRPCPVCGSAGHRELFHSYDGYPHVECVACGCWYVPLAVEADLFDAFFARCPAARALMEKTFKERLREASRQASLERIGGYLETLKPMLAGAATPRYLDLGCGLGQSLVAARARGLAAIGVESSRECLALARAEGLDVFHVSETGWDDSGFELISMWESFEHMVDPLAVLRQCAARLASRGLVAFTVPNQNSPLVRTQREDCSFVHGGYDTPGHINLFNPATIERLLKRAGFQLLALDGQYGLNLAELVSYWVGKHRGAFDLLREQTVSSPFPLETQAVIRTIGPAFALFERATLTAPILFGIACREQDAAQLAGATAAYRARRRDDVLAQIQSAMLAVGDPDLDGALRRAQDRIQALEVQLEAASAQLEEANSPLERLGRYLRTKTKRIKG